MKEKYIKLLNKIKNDKSIYNDFSKADFRDLELDRELVKINPKYYELFGSKGKNDLVVMETLLNGALNDEFEIDNEVLKAMAVHADEKLQYMIQKLVIYNSYKRLERAVENTKSSKVKVRKYNY